MTYKINVQNALKEKITISNKSLINLAKLTLGPHVKNAELTIRLVDTDEIKELNTTYRKQNKPTNVLAFPSNLPPNIKLKHHLLGDIIISPEIVGKESIELNKSFEEHMALIVIHGVLHLLGFDHIEDNDTQKMQSIEIAILNKLGYKNPYPEEGYET